VANHNDPCLHKHIDLLQAAINRMATNSSSCKTWCVTIISGIVIVSIDKEQPLAVIVSILPIIAFLLLDAYYLSLEKAFRALYDKTIEDLHSGTLSNEKLFLLKINAAWKDRGKAICKAFYSFSILPFYILLIVMLIIIYLILKNNVVHLPYVCCRYCF